MIEELFHVGSFSISPFGVLLVASLFAAYWQLRRAMRLLGIGDEDDASSIIFAVGLIGILGGKTYYAVVIGDWGDFFSRAGIVWYGSFLGGFLALVWILHRRRLPFARTFDATAPGLALGYGVGRLGCLLVGDDYGRPTDLPWGMKFKVGLPPTTPADLRASFGVETPPGLVDAEGFVAVHPTQLYESVAGFLIWGISLWLLRRIVTGRAGSGRTRPGRTRPGRWLRPGNLFAIVVALLAVQRFFVELVRLKDDRFFGDFTLAQVISVVILVAAAVTVAWRRPEPSAARIG